MYVNSCPQNHKFTGKERDPETGSDYFGARWYRYDMSRFFSPDWSSTPTGVPYANFTDPQGLNLYSYVRNNPLTMTDSDGHQEICPPCVINAISSHLGERDRKRWGKDCGGRTSCSCGNTTRS